MENLKKYDKIFCEVLEIEESVMKGLTYQGVETWDSVGHMSLIAALEDEFDIMFDTEDILDFNSYEKGKEILAEKYEINF